MSRLTKEITAYGKTYIQCDIKSCQAWECTDCQHFKEMLAKLAHYEDLEEQGRLIELPCKVGDEIWVLEYDSAFRTTGEIFKDEFEISDLPFMGSLIFTTKEEAEAKLAELRQIDE